MKSRYDFDISDYGAQRNPGWRVRWGAEGSNAVLLVNMDPKTKFKQWKLIWCTATPLVSLNEQNEFIAMAPEGHEILEKTITLDSTSALVNQVKLPKILYKAWEDAKSNLPAPRRKQSEPYIGTLAAEELEKQFFNQVAPLLDSHTVYAVHESGTRLCNRLNIDIDSEIYVNHYEHNTYQDDKGIKVDAIPISDPHKPVLVIDDMVSSGHTAAAILEKFNQIGVTKVRFFALYSIIASRENHDVDSAIEYTTPLSNFYWVYGRGMDLFDEESRRLKSIYGADKSYADETKGDVDDLLNFFGKQ